MPDNVIPRPGLPPEVIIERIKKALAIDDTHTWDDMREMLIDGRCQIFYNEHGAWITEILTSPRKRLLNVWIVAGELPEVMELQQKVMDFARSMTCSELIVRGARAGWRDIAKAYGWEEAAIVLRQPVTGV